MKTHVTALLCFAASSLFAQKSLCQLDFDGTDDYLSADSICVMLAGSNQFTVEFWMKGNYLQNTAAVRTTIFAVNPAPPVDNRFSIVMGSFVPSMQTGLLTMYDANTNPIYLTSSTMIGDNQCHHIAYVRNNWNSQCFIDGVSMGTMPAGSAIAATDRFSFGMEWDLTVPSDFYHGMLDEIRIWNIARTQSQLIADMNNSLTGNESGLIAYYNFNQGYAGGNNLSQTSVIDFSSGNYNATFHNFALTGTSSNLVAQVCANANSVDEFQNITTSVFPNPFSSTSTITVAENMDNAVLQLFSITGELLLTEKFSGNTYTISRNGWCAGSYYFRITDEQNRSAFGKLLIAE